MRTISTTDYIMEDPREAVRLAQKVDPTMWVETYLARHIQPGAEVLSVGCGPGTIIRAICEAFPTIRATGLDISPMRIRQAAGNNSGNTRVQFVCGDANSIQLPSRKFDVVFTRMMLQYVEHKDRVLSEIVRVLKPGGICILQDLDGQLLSHYPEDPIMQNALDQVVRALGQTGFDPFVGRKLFWFAQKAGLENLEVKVESYHLIAGEVDPTILDQWKLKLEIVKPYMVQVFGSEREAAEQIGRFLDYLRRPDTLTFSNVFTVTGKKPLLSSPKFPNEKTRQWSPL